MIDAEHNYNDFLIQSLYQTKIIKQHNANINSIDFSSDGKKILTSGDDDSNIFDRRFLLDQADGQLTFFPNPVSQAELLQRAVGTAGMLRDADHSP